MFLNINLILRHPLIYEHVLIKIRLLSPNCGQEKNYYKYKGIKQ